MASDAGSQILTASDILLRIGNPIFIFCLVVTLLVFIYLHRNKGIVAGASSFLRSTTWRLEDSLALAMFLIFLLFLARALLSILLLKGLLLKEHMIPAGIIIQTLIFQVPVIALVFRALYIRERRILAPLGVHPKSMASDLAKGFVVYLAAIPLMTAANFLSWGLLQCLHVQPDIQDPLKILLSPQPQWIKMYIVVSAVILAPVAEELLFRGVCFPALARETSPLRSAILTSLLFAAVHQNAHAVLPLFTLALILCAAYACTRSILVPIAMHSVYNLIGIAVFMSNRMPAE